jgi:hypothetical protein
VDDLIFDLGCHLLAEITCSLFVELLVWASIFHSSQLAEVALGAHNTSYASKMVKSSKKLSTSEEFIFPLTHCTN